ncbi:MAG: formylglycine-generating enzyme family protein [Hyphomonadaceae bacterium JAD_PAG50586_4]|nr:MAG: formylglycine-generating enzyme family protein [Hyphomonadaceae bacterium JAD_PAG50586_4]
MRVVLVLAAALLFLVSACAHMGDAGGAGGRQPQEFLPDGGPPIVNGFYEVGGECEHDSCPDVRADRAVELRDRPHPDGAIVGSTTRGEWVNWLSHHYRFRPIRGVVLRARETGNVRLQAGDVVYIVDTQTEYYADDVSPTAWFRGETFYYQLDEGEADYVRWEYLWHSPSAAQRAADEVAGAGAWFEVRRANGERGFARMDDFSCWWGRDDLCDPERIILPQSDCPGHDISWECQERRSSAEPNVASYSTPRPFRDCANCPSMVWIPGQAFAAGQYELTFAEWDACVAAGGCTGSTPYDEGWGRGNRPVIGVRWADAQAYVQWLSAHTGQRYRLLTTDEWVAAAFPGGRRQNYSWGNDAPVCDPGARNGAAHNACMPQRTMPVGTFQPNAYGLYDTIGNVGEWLQEPYEPGDGRHAIIGSSWASGLGTLGGRGGGWDTDFGADTGFRVARER